MGPHETAGPTAETATTKLYDTTVPAGGLCLYQATMSNHTVEKNCDINTATGTSGVSQHSLSNF